VVLAGDAEGVRQRFEAYRTAGVDEPAGFLVSGQSDLQAVRAELERRPQALAGLPKIMSTRGAESAL